MPKISIIVPIYKVKKEYLVKCIDSLINQTFKNIEIILVDDGSPDESGNICDNYATLDERIKVIHQENSGVSVARNKGINESKGEWLIFVDADDWIELDTCEQYAKAIEYNNIDMILSKSYIYFNSNKIDESYSKYKSDAIINNKKELIESLFLVKNKDNVSFTYIGAPWGKCLKKSILMENNIFFKNGVKIGEDALFNYRYFSVLDNVMFINKSFYYYRMNDNSVTNSYISDLIETYYILFESFDEYIKKVQIVNKSVYSAFVIRQLFRCLEACIFNENTVLSNFEKKNKFFNLISSKPYLDSIKNVRVKDFRMKNKIIITLLKLKFYNCIKLLYFIKSKYIRLRRKNAKN